MSSSYEARPEPMSDAAELLTPTLGERAAADVLWEASKAGWKDDSWRVRTVREIVAAHASAPPSTPAEGEPFFDTVWVRITNGDHDGRFGWATTNPDGYVDVEMEAQAHPYLEGGHLALGPFEIERADRRPAPASTEGER